jgi:hypothetical protein
MFNSVIYEWSSRSVHRDFGVRRATDTFVLHMNGNCLRYTARGRLHSSILDGGFLHTYKVKHVSIASHSHQPYGNHDHTTDRQETRDIAVNFLSLFPNTRFVG